MTTESPAEMAFTPGKQAGYPFPRAGSVPPPLRKSSTSSFSKLEDFHLDGPPEPSPPLSPEPAARTSLDGTESDGSVGSANSSKPARVKGVRHIDLSVDASEWRHPVFKTKILSILRRTKVPRWSNPSLSPSSIHLLKVSGALTNAVFFISYNPSRQMTSPTMSPLLTPTMPPADPGTPFPVREDEIPPTVLLRIYGPSSGALISRTEELRILHVLSSQYGLGPKVYGTFSNGRLEQFFPSRALTADELRSAQVSRGIACRMRELHSVDLRALGYDQGTEGEPFVWRSLRDWVGLAKEVIGSIGARGGKWEVWEQQFALHRVEREVEAYKAFVDKSDKKGKGRVFAHNDTQYGNILRLDRELAPGEAPHHRLIVVDFEYAAPNARGYDIANHFHEWRANYHHPTHSHSLSHHEAYPSLEERERFYRAYLSLRMNPLNGEEELRKSGDISQDKVKALEEEVKTWSPASSVFWALWGVIQAEEQVAAVISGEEKYEVEFDYLSYALERMQMFRKEAAEIGVQLE